MALLVPASVAAQEAPAEPAEQPPSLASTLGIPGISPRLDLTGFADSLVGGDGDGDVKLTGRADLYTDFSSDGLGLWKGTLLRTHFEWREGADKVLGRGGALLPLNTAALLPVSGEGPELTSFYIVQSLAPATMLIMGKINAVDLLDTDPFFGGMGTKRFQNISFVAPPNGVMPPVLMGGILAHQAGSVGITAMVFDPEDRTDDYWVDGLFSSGVNLSLGATWGGAVNGHATSIGLTGIYSTARGLDYDNLLLPPDIARPTKKGSYNIALKISHILKPSKVDPKKGLGFYGNFAISDGNPNLIQSSIAMGLAGHGVVAGRENDSFGLGGFYYDFSNALQDTVAPFVNFDDEMGLEAWYSFALSRNMALSVDAQIVDPASGGRDTVFILGGRLGFSF